MADAHFSGGSFWWRVLRDGLVTVAKGIGCAFGLLVLAYIGFVVWFNWTGGLDANMLQDFAQADAARLRVYIIEFRTRHGSYPATLDELVAEKDGRPPLIEGGPFALNDPWGNRYQFEIIPGDETNPDEEVAVWTVSPKGERIESPRSLARRRR